MAPEPKDLSCQASTSKQTFYQTTGTLSGSRSGDGLYGFHGSAQRKFSRDEGWRQVEFTRSSDIGKASYRDGSSYAPKAALYAFFYVRDAAYQALAYWIMGSITNDPFKLARYAGFYKAIQSAGAAGSFGMDAAATPFLNELVCNSLYPMSLSRR